ncbi:indole-3-glycerol-phosphate synthase [Patescibacteria group bacterium]|nr:indole-3-glycerol-phosphate synthase [Patescibacteria group bacterium]MBU4481572.1 indole-3-glycerol-phosphate synthase [Patescibacteria group bacterium]
MRFDWSKLKREKIKEIKALKERRSLILVLEKKIKEGEIPIITEVKKASPERKIREIDVVKAAKEMERGGACAISVLTDKNFQGSLEDLKRVKREVKVPVLRKDFIFDQFQIYESYANGADAILLIVSLLKEKTKKFVEKTHRLGMETLVEIRSEKELKFALDSGAKLLGINNRDLKTMKVDLTTTEKLAPKIPRDRIIISESGINDKNDLERVLKAGAKAVLIGTSIMLAENIREKVKEFVNL